MAKFIILERAAREGKITIDHVASFLRTQLNDVNKKLGLNSSSITFNSKESKSPTIVLNFDGDKTRKDVFNVIFGGTKEEGVADAVGFLLKDLLNKYDPENMAVLTYNKERRHNDEKYTVRINAPQFKQIFTLKVNNPKRTGKGAGESELSTSNERELIPIIDAYNRLGRHQELNHIMLGIDKKYFNKAITLYNNFKKNPQGKYNKEELMKQGEMLSIILEKNPKFHLNRGKGNLYEDIRKYGKNLLQKTSGLEKLSKDDKYTPADLILVKDNAIPKTSSLFEFNNYFANDLTMGGKINSVNGDFYFIGISQKQDETAQGGGGKMFFTIVNKNIYTVNIPKKLNLQTLEDEYNKLNNNLQQEKDVEVYEEDNNNKFFQFSKRDYAGIGKIPRKLLIGKYIALQMLKFLIYGQAKDVGQKIQTTPGRPFAPSIKRNCLKLIEYSMCAGTKTQEKQNSVYVYPCFYKVVGGGFPTPLNNSQLEFNISPKKPIIIKYNPNSIVLYIPLILFIKKGTKEKEKPIEITMPFTINGATVQPTLTNLGDFTIDENREAIQSKISEFLEKLEQFK
jgi:hypothetical protein